MKRSVIAALASLLLLACPCLAGWYGMTASVMPSSPHVGDMVRLSYTGAWSDSCIPDDVQVFRNGGTIHLFLYENEPWQPCLTVITPWSTMQDVGQLPAGTYDVYVSLVVAPPGWGAGPEHILTFTVLPEPAGCDINADGDVDVLDLLYLLDAFGAGTGQPRYGVACDFNRDGSVDVVDLMVLLADFGRT